ncbi:MAG: sugar ABC transporter permease [Caldilineaceae bacterium]
MATRESTSSPLAARLPGTSIARPRMSAARRREALQGYLYILPWIIGFLFFVAGPLFASLYYSFTYYPLLAKPSWVGLQNYTMAFFQDRIFWLSSWRTLQWALTTVPLGIIGSFFAALLLNRNGLRLKTVWRVFFFLPSLTPEVAAALLWLWILQPDVGVVNSTLKAWFGIRGPDWLASPSWALPSLVMISLWTGIGSIRMLIFLAGLQGVPQELYDAGMVDGVNTWQKIWHITLPMISPTILLNLILGVIGSLQVFGLAFVTTGGGPAYATYFFGLHLYQTAFRSFDMGYGSALAWFLFTVILVLTLIQISFSRRWVYYAGDAQG